MPSYSIPYCDLSWAEQYFQERSNSDTWNDASESDKTAALATATRDIFRYAKFTETVVSDNEEEHENVFKYAYDGTETRPIPDQLKEACCEQAIYKLTINRLDAIDATRAGIANAKGVTFDRNAIPNQLADECIDILLEIGADVSAAAGGSGMNWTRMERIER